MKDVKQLVARISGHRNRECYVVLIHAVKAAQAYQPQEPKMETIVADVAVMMDGRMKPATISRNLSRAAADIWEYGDRQELCKVYGHPVQDPPTPKELVLRLAEAVWEGEQPRQRQRAVYRWWKSLSGDGYGISIKLRNPAYHAVTCPLCGDFEQIRRLVQRLNEDQVSLGVFEERYLDGSLLDWLEQV